ncbi:MAG: hypothetical protein M3P51_01760 [Chloroflexota bacterium]|nr:hypothetical protein [Chloroflexota bacterium]
MENIRVLVANEPRSYREAVASVLQEIRPSMHVACAEPDSLDTDVLRLEPHLVVCSHLSSIVETWPVSWILLYPDSYGHAVGCVAGERTEYPNIEFHSLVAIVDQTAKLVLER